MLDILMRNKKVYLINEHSISLNETLTHYAIVHHELVNPIEREILKRESSNQIELHQNSILNSRLIIKSLANAPELFNTVNSKSTRGSLCSN